jgi:hypothetical protein
VADCTLTVSGTPLYIIDDYTCGTGYYQPIPKTEVDTLIFGYGLGVAQSGSSKDYTIENNFRLQDTTDWYCDNNNPWATLSNIRFPKELQIGVGLDVVWDASGQTADTVCTGILQTTLNFNGSGCDGDHIYGVENVEAGCGINFSHYGSSTCESDNTKKTKNVKITVDPDACDGTATEYTLISRVGASSGIVSGTDVITQIDLDKIMLRFSSCGLFLGTGIPLYCQAPTTICPTPAPPPP